MIIFMGVPGAGKSMQGRKLADEQGWPWLSTGEFLRMLISGDRRKDMLAGKLLSDTEIISLVQKVFDLVDTEHQFVLDGFPRTLAQADWLLTQVKYGQIAVTAVIHIKASPDAVRDRLLARGRQDDQEEVIAERFKEYEQAILPIINHFAEAQVPILEINGEQTIQEVHDDVVKALDDVQNKPSQG